MGQESLKEIDPKNCDNDNKSNQNSNIEREVCEPQPCCKLTYLNRFLLFKRFK